MIKKYLNLVLFFFFGGLTKFLDIIFQYHEEDSLISKEGYEILADPRKRKLLREAIEHYHRTGSWELLDKIHDDGVG